MKVAAKSRAAFISALSASSRSAGTRSILLIASATVRARRQLRGERLEDRPHALGQAAMRLDQQHHHVGVRRAAPGRLDHRPVEPAARAEEAGRVDEDDLRRALDRDAADAASAWSAPCG